MLTINGSPVNPIDLRADAPLTAITVPKFVYPKYAINWDAVNTIAIYPPIPANALAKLI